MKREERRKKIEIFLEPEDRDFKSADYDFKNEMRKYYEQYKKNVCEKISVEEYKEMMKKMPDEEQSNIKNFEAYKTADLKLADKEKNLQRFDCDSWNDTCELSTAIYEILWNYEKNGHVHSWAWKDVDEGRNSFCSFGPDTMNSFTTTNNRYYELHKQGEFKKEKTGLEESLEMFAGRTHTLGNFVLVPYGFNRGRYPNTQDYWDLSLGILKKDGYTISKEKVFKTDNFSKYINTFFLWDYVYCENGGEYETKSLFSDNFQESGTGRDSHSILMKLKNEGEGSCVPQNYKEITNFLKNVNWAIKRRGIFMVAMLRIASMTDESQVEIKELENWKNWEVSIWYKLIMEEILYKDTVMAGYDSVFKEIDGCLNGYKDLPKKQKIKEIIKEAQDNINKVKLS